MSSEPAEKPPFFKGHESTLLAVGIAVVASIVALGLAALCVWALAGPVIMNLFSGSAPVR